MLLKSSAELLISGWLAIQLHAAEGISANTELNNPQAEAVECRMRGGLPNLFLKLNQGHTVRMAYLGGSITAQEGWRPKSLAWFQEKYPQAKIVAINAAIGGTGSDLGVFRLQQDVLAHQPDLLWVEFAVNDGGAAPAQIYRCMEGIVRQTWRQNPATDICFVYTLAGNMLQTLQQGQFPRSASAMEKVADHYAIPSIHLGIEVARLEKAGQLIFKGDQPKTEEEKLALAGKILFSPDAVHPYPDSGHQLYLEAIARSMVKLESVGKASPHSLGAPLVADNWEAAKMVPVGKARLSAGWQRLDPATNNLAKRFHSQLSNLWKANAPGETISFRFQGTAVGIYDLLGPDCGQVVVNLDDRPAVVQPRFDAYCTYHRLGKLMVGERLANTVHTVKLTIHPEQPDKVNILKQRNEKMDNAKRYDDRAWYAGSILLLGDMLNEP